MLTNELNKLYQRDLDRLIAELNLYKSEEHIWAPIKGINNPGGNLCLHLIGNLNMFIGNVLGDTGYIRKRDDEFSLKNIPREQLIKMIQDTQIMISDTLSNLGLEMLSKIYPIRVFKEEMTIEYFIIHLLSHLTYHLGQVNYHRRILY